MTYNRRFPGQYRDEETGLHYNYFRDYDPTIGRYIQADPVGHIRDFSNPQLQSAMELGLEFQIEVFPLSTIGLNSMFGYVNQNPVVFSDPLGLLHPYCEAKMDACISVCVARNKGGIFNPSKCGLDCIEKWGVENCKPPKRPPPKPPKNPQQFDPLECTS